MQTTADSPALIQTVHGTSFPFVGLARVSQSSIVGSKAQPGDSAIPKTMKSDSTPSGSTGQNSEA